MLNAQRVSQLLHLSRRRRRWSWRARRMAMLAVVALAAVLMLTGRQGDPAWRRHAPLLLLGGVLAASWWLAWRLRMVHRRYNQAMLAVQTSQWVRAYSALARLLSSAIPSVPMRVTALLALGEVAGRAGRHDEVIEIMDEVLNGPTSPQHEQIALVEKAHALLRAGRLTDATALLESFRTMEFPEPMATMVEVAQLYRRIRTRNFAAIAAEADTLARKARAVLHRRAAGVYALLALALEQAGQATRAQAYYECATLLMCPEELTGEFAELAGLDHRLVPARSPL